jgi:hypothetical protein
VPDERPAEFIDLCEDAFPFLIELLELGTEKVVWSQLVEEPGAVIVPSREELGVTAVWVRVSYSDGTVHEHTPQEQPDA